MSNYTKGLIFALAQVFCFSILETIGSLGFKSGVTPLTLMTVRFLVAAVLFGITIFVWKRSIFKVAREDIKWIVLPGIIMVGETFAYWQSLKLLDSVALLMTLFYLCPLWTVLLFIIFRKKKFDRNIWISVFLAITGVAFASQLIPNGPGLINWPGVSLALLSGLGWSFYFISIQRIVSKYHPFTILFYSFSLVAIASMIIQNPAITISQLNPESLRIMLIMAVVNTYLAYILLSAAIYFNKAVKSNLLDTLTMPISIGLAFLVLGQTITIWQGLGIAMILFITYLLRKPSA